MAPQTGNQIVDRAIKVSTFDIPTFEEIERDSAATQQAAIVVGVVAIAGGIGGLSEGFGGFVVGVVAALASWFIFSFIAHWVGTNLFSSPTSAAPPWEGTLRSLGFAQAPAVINVLLFIPVLGGIISFAAFIWVICTSVVGIRQSLNITTGRAVITAIVAGILAGVVRLILSLIFGVI